MWRQRQRDSGEARGPPPCVRVACRERAPPPAVSRESTPATMDDAKLHHTGPPPRTLHPAVVVGRKPAQCPTTLPRLLGEPNGRARVR
jgi:hypothetical protein